MLTAGQKIETRQGDRRFGLVQQLSLEEFLNILQSDLINGFADEIPRLNRVREAFQRLYPDVPLPIPAPRLPISRPRVLSLLSMTGRNSTIKIQTE